MKTKTILFVMVALLFLIGGVGCEKEDNTIYPEAVIIKELPVMYGALVEHGTVQLIQSQQELNKLFNGSTPTFPKELTNIDFEKSSLIMGTWSCSQGIDKLEHILKKMQSGKYLYLLTIKYNDTLVAPIVTFGIIINKLPAGVNIELEVKEVKSQK